MKRELDTRVKSLARGFVAVSIALLLIVPALANPPRAKGPYDFDPGLPNVLTDCGPYGPEVTTYFVNSFERRGPSTFLWWGCRLSPPGAVRLKTVDHRVEIRCEEKTMRTVRTVISSSKQTENGNIVSDTALSAELEPVVPGTMNAVIYRIACINPRPHSP